VNLLSFRQDARDVLGEYMPSEGAVVVDPLWTRAGVPEAIAIHEVRHQFLYRNTTFGLFTQLLTFMVERGSQSRGPRGSLAQQRQEALDLKAVALELGRKVLPKCFENQWCVQELAATYAEISYVAARHPELFEQEVRGLPSARLDQPPYREVFDTMDRLLPVDPRRPKELSDAQAELVGLLVAASMNSDCLVRMQKLPWDVGASPKWVMDPAKALLACMKDPPYLRLERIMNHLVANGLLEPLREEAAREFRRSADSSAAKNPPSPGAAEILYERIVTLIPQLAIYRDADIPEQAHYANLAWKDLTGVNVPKERATEPFPAIKESRQREQQGLAAHPVSELPPIALRERLKLTVQNTLGLTLEFWLKEPSQAFVAARSYFLKKGAAPCPGGKEDEGRSPLPVDVHGLMSTPDIFRELAPFPALPHIVVFGDDSWRRWYKVPGGRPRFEACVQVCRQTHLTQDYVLYLLQFVQEGDELPDFIVRDLRAGRAVPLEALGEGAEFFLIKLGLNEHVGCIFNRRRPLVYGLQKLPADLGIQLFLTICQTLGIQQCQESRPVLYTDLLTMVAFDFVF